MYWPGQRQRVDPGEPAGRALRVVAGGGDLRVTHAVADQQDDVAGVAADDGLAHGVGPVAVVAGGAALVGQVVGRRAGGGEGAGDGDRESGEPGDDEPGPRGACIHAEGVLPSQDVASSRPAAGEQPTTSR